MSTASTTETRTAQPAIDVDIMIDWVRSGLAQALGRLHYVAESCPSLLDQELRRTHDELMQRLKKPSISSSNPATQAQLEIRQRDWLTQHLAGQSLELLDYANRRAERRQATPTRTI